MTWPAHDYPAVKSNPFALMSRDDQLRFVTCSVDEAEIEQTACWLRGLKIGNRALCIYKDGKPYRVVQ